MDKCLKSVSLHVLNSTWLLDLLLFFPHRQKSGGKKKKNQTNNKTPTYKVKLKKKRGGEKVCVFEDLDDLESIKILL